MTDKKTELDPVAIMSIYASLLHRVDQGLEERLAASSARMKNFFEGVRHFFAVISFRHVTTPVAIVGVTHFYYFPESKELGMRTEARELRVFGIRLARWPVTQELVKYKVDKNPFVENEKDALLDGVKKAAESPDEPDALGSSWQEEKKP